MKTLCSHCGRIEEAYKFTDDGRLCETCVKRASAIVTVYVIGERAYIEHLKRPAVVPNEKEKAPAVSGAKE